MNARSASVTYKTIGDQEYILDAINHLYLEGKGVEVDPMYGKGGFYKGSFPPPLYIGDISGTPKIDARCLPFADGSMNSMILDPPFMHALGKDSEMQRYGTYKSQKELAHLYVELLGEASRVLMDRGILIFKCQDTVESGKQVWVHTNVKLAAPLFDFGPEDLFICLAKSRMTGHNHGRQKHARKFHSYFWVFRRKTRARRKNLVLYDSAGRPYHQLPLESDDAVV